MIEFTSDKNATNVTITAALPYVNGVKHLGNLVGSILPADIFHRFLDARDIPNIFICGTDNHGTAVELAAREDGTDPKKYAQKYYEIQKEIYEKWNFDFTFFGQTSSQTNHETTQQLFTAAKENGYVQEKEMTLPYCRTDERYLPDRYMQGTCPKCEYEHARGDQCEKCGTVLDPKDLIEPKCAICGRSDIEFREERHLFLDFSALQEKLRLWIRGKKWPATSQNFALGWIREGLEPRCITRNLEWGVPVPAKGYEDKVFYVWFDAPVGYVSITKDAAAAERIDGWEEWWLATERPNIYHFVGKDNVPFHTIFWPGSIIAARNGTNYALPHHVQGYEYLNWEGEKFSTSRGNGLFSDEALSLFRTDYWRFYLASVLPETKDSSFSWNDFAKRINNELIANYGNLFYRVTSFIQKNFDGRVPEGTLSEKEEAVRKRFEDGLQRVEKLVDEVKLRSALREVMALAAAANKYFQDAEPWVSVKDDKEKAATALYVSVNLLRIVSTLLKPYVPESAEAALTALGAEPEWSTEFALQPGHKIRSIILYDKIDDDELARARAYRTKHAKDKSSGPNVISMSNGELPFDEFKKVDMRAATVTSVKDHPDADKLYVLTVDMGDERRQLVAGLKGIVPKDDLKGKQVIIVANLEPKELRGVKSHGMLLAAEDGTPISPSGKVKNGARIM